MKRRLAAAAFIVCSASPAFPTWSIVAMDQSTGTAVIASATCVAQASFRLFPARGLMDVQAIVVPGKGIAAAQAAADPTRRNQDRIFVELDKGTPPQQIIDVLKADPEIEFRQFGIVDIQGRVAGFSGSKNSPSSLNRQGQVPGTGVFYSLQGNILASDDVVLAA